MPVPKRRHSKSRTRKRRSHHAIIAPQVTFCPQCQAAVLTHIVCPTCGYYQGRTLVESKD